jgi:hypothetical protein
MASVTRYVSDTLRLTVNPLKSAVDRPMNRKFLGFTVSRNGAKLKVADQAIEKLQGPLAGTDPSYARHQHWRTRRGAERNPAWLESVLRHCRGAESSARDRQVGTTQVALLSLETMGVGWLSGTAQARHLGARSVEHQQVGPWSMAAVEDAGSCPSRYHCASSSTWDYPALRHGRNSIHRTAGYVTRTSGGVGGGGREAFSYPDWACEAKS